MERMKENGKSDDLSSRLQWHGVLSKKSNTQQSNKWTKRFFVVKDSILAYYTENEKKEFEKRRQFNVHAKGVYSVGNARIEEIEDIGHRFCILITTDICGEITLAAETSGERDKWIEVLKHAARITWQNVEIGDTVIKQLESQGLELAQEKQTYLDKYQSEVIALHDEKCKTEELERIREELEKEKRKIEDLAQEMKLDYQQMKSELQDTAKQMETVEEDKYKLESATQSLQVQLQILEAEKTKIKESLNAKEHETVKLCQEKNDLSTITTNLKEQLSSIEHRTKHLQQEQSQFQEKLRDNEERSLQLEAEKEAISDHARELRTSIKDLSMQKAATESELKDEIVARITAEKRLNNAEKSLARIDAAVSATTNDTKTQDEQEELREEMKSDVDTLKRFFENLAFEAKLDADKSVMIKNSIHARKSFVRRASTLRYESRRKRSSRDMHIKPGGRPPSTHNLLSNMPTSPLAIVNMEEIDDVFTSHSLGSSPQSGNSHLGGISPLSPLPESPNAGPFTVLTPSQRSLLRPDRLRSISQEDAGT